MLFYTQTATSLSASFSLLYLFYLLYLIPEPSITAMMVVSATSASPYSRRLIILALAVAVALACSLSAVRALSIAEQELPRSLFDEVHHICEELKDVPWSAETPQRIRSRISNSSFTATDIVNFRVDYRSMTILHVLAYGCEVNAEAIDILVSLGADLEAEDADGRTALHLAAESGCVDNIKALDRNGARMMAVVGNAADSASRGLTALHLAVKNQAPNTQSIEDTIEALSSAESINAKDTGAQGMSPLALAVSLQGDERWSRKAGRTMKALIKFGADVNAKHQGEPLLQMAARLQHEHNTTHSTMVFRVLLDDENTELTAMHNETRDNILHVTVRNNLPELVKLVLLYNMEKADRVKLLRILEPDNAVQLPEEIIKHIAAFAGTIGVHRPRNRNNESPMSISRRPSSSDEIRVLLQEYADNDERLVNHSIEQEKLLTDAMLQREYVVVDINNSSDDDDDSSDSNMGYTTSMSGSEDNDDDE